jgi:hypothetical protein
MERNDADRPRPGQKIPPSPRGRKKSPGKAGMKFPAFPGEGKKRKTKKRETRNNRKTIKQSRPGKNNRKTRNNREAGNNREAEKQSGNKKQSKGEKTIGKRESEKPTIPEEKPARPEKTSEKKAIEKGQ